MIYKMISKDLRNVTSWDPDVISSGNHPEFINCILNQLIDDKATIITKLNGHDPRIALVNPSLGRQQSLWLVFMAIFENHEKVSILGNIITILAISFGERMQNKEWSLTFSG